MYTRILGPSEINSPLNSKTTVGPPIVPLVIFRKIKINPLILTRPKMKFTLTRFFTGHEIFNTYTKNDTITKILPKYAKHAKLIGKYLKGD